MGNYSVYMQCKDGQRLQWMQRVFTFPRPSRGLPLHYACETSQRASAARPLLPIAPLIIVLLKSEKAIKSASASCVSHVSAFEKRCVHTDSQQPDCAFPEEPYPDEHLIKDILIQQNKNA